MPHMLQGRLEMLERTVLELGAELYNVKGKMAKHQDTYQHMLGIMKGLKHLLDEKGMISIEDFDAAIELGEALDPLSSRGPTPPLGLLPDHNADKGKKSGH